MNTFEVYTEGQKITQSFSQIFTLKNTGKDVGVMILHIGSARVDIKFNTPEEMIEFCQAHNFTYEDIRNNK